MRRRELTTNLLPSPLSETTVRQILLTILNGQDTILYGVRNDQAVDKDVLQLSKAVHTVERLALDGSTPREVQGDNTYRDPKERLSYEGQSGGGG